MDFAELKPAGYRFPVELACDWSTTGKPPMPNYWHRNGSNYHYLQLVRNPKVYKANEH